MALHTKILFGLVVGLVAGIGANLLFEAAGWDATVLETTIINLTDPVGQVFLRLLFMIVVPLVFTSLSLGVANLGGRHSLGRTGLKTMAMFIVLTVLAVLIGMVMVQAFEPGRGFDPQTQARLMEKYGETSSQVITTSRGIHINLMTFLDMLMPKNILRAIVDMQMLPTILFAFLFGAMLMRLSPTLTESVKRGLSAGYEFSVRIVDMAMRFAPYAVPCLVFGIAARFGLSILKPLGMYVIIVFIGYAVHMGLTYSVILRLFARTGPWYFYKAVKSVLVTAFSTSSSSATLPTTIRVTEEVLKVSPNITGFVLPLGATINMNGTALYEGVTVLFIAQIFGVDLSAGQQALVIVMTVLTAIGTAGIPGGSLPMIVLVMQSVGVPPEGIGIILGVDRILDMGRTVVNVTGDMVTTLYIDRTQPPSGQP